MEFNSKYFFFSISTDPKGRAALIFIGLAALFTIIDQITKSFWGFPFISPLNIAYGFLGAGGIKALEFVKIREAEIQFEKELKGKELKCKYCDMVFYSVQDYRIHVDLEERKRIGR